MCVFVPYWGPCVRHVWFSAGPESIKWNFVVLMRSGMTQGYSNVPVWLHTQKHMQSRATGLRTHTHTHTAVSQEMGYISAGVSKHTLSTSSSLALRLFRPHLSFRHQREINGFSIFSPPLLCPRYSSTLSRALAHCVSSLLSAQEVAPTPCCQGSVPMTLLHTTHVYCAPLYVPVLIR